MGNITTKKTTTAIAETQFDNDEFAGLGFENINASDLIIPSIIIAQGAMGLLDGRPEMSGSFYNTGTEEFIDGKKGFIIQPVYTEEKYLELQQDADNTFVGYREINDPVVKYSGLAEIETRPGKMGKARLVNSRDPKSNRLFKTGIIYAIMLDQNGTDSLGCCVIKFKKSKYPIFKKWRSELYQQKNRPPLMRYRAHITAVSQKNDDGKSYVNFKIAPFGGGGWVSSLLDRNDPAQAQLFDDGVRYYRSILEGAVRAAEVEDDDYEAPHDTNAAVVSVASDDDIPF